MDFDFFIRFLPKLQKATLIGQEAHWRMAPEQRIEELKNSNWDISSAKNAAVLILFFPDSQNNTRFVLIRRNKYPGVHSDQISFPGGQKDPADRDLEITALRETEEEIGVSRNEITLLRPLSTVFIPPSNFLVTPFIGYCKDQPFFLAEPKEVAEILEVNLSQLLEPKTKTLKKLQTSYAQEIEIPTYIFSNNIVWGATAMILSELELLVYTYL